MFIVSSTKDTIINVDNVVSVRIDGKRIIAVTKVDDYMVGVYKTEDRAKEVFKEILDTVFTSMLVLKNCYMNHEDLSKFTDAVGATEVCKVRDTTNSAYLGTINQSVYYMPEE